METRTGSNFRLNQFLGLAFAALLLVTACTPEGVINKTRYNGEKVTNTCDTFTEEVNQIINGNSNPSDLVVAEYDNSDFDYYYLEPGQWEVKDGSLNYRLAQDLEYGKYLTKGVAIHVVASYASLDHLANIESPNAGDIGTLIVDEAYYNSHKDPFFLYQIPVSDDITGKQISLKFSVVKYKKGKIKKVFCNSVEVPLGPVTPACCSFLPWEGSSLQSVIEMPDVDIKDETYRYRGFTGTLDLIFPENSTQFDKKLLSSAIKDHIKKYDSLGFKARNIKLEGWASLGGKEDFNQKLSEKRAKAVYDDLNSGMKDTTITMEYQGKGEDWERLVLLTKTSVLSGEEQSAVLGIANGPGTNDEKEAEMRKLPFWNKLVEEVIVNTRHTFVTFNFDYQPDKMWIEYYPSQIPVMSKELYNIAEKTMVIGRWQSGDTKKGLKTLDILIGNNKKGNLFAMRSTYHFGNNDFQSAIADIEKALLIDKGNTQYALAGLAYKTKFADNYDIKERMDMLDMYNDYINQFPNNRGLHFNRAVMMDKVGAISGAMKEYSELLEGNQASAANLNNRGVAKLKTNRITEAQADFKAATEKDPKLAEAYFNLALINAIRGFTNKATDNLDKALMYNADLKKEIFSNKAFRVMKETPAFDKYR
ncbi:MAG: hypothetical protein H6581_00330 [Bacteroidia bacterium]|nr:hypothetical protein [Bacteroidia bacterium]